MADEALKKRAPRFDLLQYPHHQEAPLATTLLKLSDLVGDASSICGRQAALILRLQPAGLRFGEFRSPLKQGRVGLQILKSQRVEACCDLNLQPKSPGITCSLELWGRCDPKHWRFVAAGGRPLSSQRLHFFLQMWFSKRNSLKCPPFPELLRVQTPSRTKKLSLMNDLLSTRSISLCDTTQREGYRSVASLWCPFPSPPPF